MTDTNEPTTEIVTLVCAAGSTQRILCGEDLTITPLLILHAGINADPTVNALPVALVELASTQARLEHDYHRPWRQDGGAAGHTFPFEQCPHHTCAAIRSARK